MLPTFEYSLIRYRADQDLNYKGTAENEDTNEKKNE